MIMEYDAMIDESQTNNNNFHIQHRLPWTTLSILRPTMQWKRNDSPSDKKNDHNRNLSTGAGVAFVIALAAGIALIVLVTVFVFFRKRYGPRYTFRSFFSGLRPGEQRGDGRDSSMPVSISMEAGFPCNKMNSYQKDRRSKPRSSIYVTRRDLCRMSGGLGSLGQMQQPPPTHAPAHDEQSAASNRSSTPRYSYRQRPQTENNNSTQTEHTTKHNKSSPRTATEHLKALAPQTPSSPSTPFTASTQSSGPLPSMYRMCLGSMNLNYQHQLQQHQQQQQEQPQRWSLHHDARSAVDSEDRVLSLPSPSPILKHTLQSYPRAEESSSSESSAGLPGCYLGHVSWMQTQMQSPRVVSGPEAGGLESDSRDGGLMLPRSVYAVDSA